MNVGLEDDGDRSLSVFGCISEGTTSVSLKKFIGVYIISVLVVNVGITLLTGMFVCAEVLLGMTILLLEAGRIIWIAKEVKAIMGPDMVSQYHFAIGVL